jgi:hypothetical protein
MTALLYILFLLLCSGFMGLLGFWIGRCARKLPIIDGNLPWTLNRDQIQAAPEIPEESQARSLRWPQ